MAVRIKDFFRNLTTGNGISGRTVLLKRHVDDVQIASTTTGSDGSFQFTDSDTSYRGPVYYTVDDGTSFKRHSGKSLGQTGPLWIDDLLRTLENMGPGIVAGLTVSGGLGTMNVSVAAGAAILKDGLLYTKDAAQNVAITTADGTNPRIDSVVIRATRRGETEEGNASIVVIAGTPAGSPVAPSLTQTSATWDTWLADVLVDAGVTSIASGKVTDRRSYAVRLLPPPGNNGDLMTVSGGQWVPVAPGAAAATFTVNSNGTPVSSAINTTDYASAFSVSNSPSNQVNIGIATAGITSGHIAAGAVTSGKIGAAAVGNTELSNGSVTSGKLATDAVLTTRIADAQVTGAKIANTTITGANLASGAVTAGKIAADAVTATEIAAGAVGSSELASFAVTAGKIATGGVSNTLQIADGIVTTAKIAAASIGTGSGKLAASDHTHLLTDPTFAQAIAGYTFHSVGTSITTVANQNTGVLASGKRYFVYARADGQGNAPSGGNIQMYVRIEAGGSNTAGTTTGVASGERPINAQDAKIVTGTGATINVAARAGTDTGTGSITDASVHCIVIPLDVPAS